MRPATRTCTSRRFKLLAGLVRIFGKNLRQRVREIVFRRIRLLPQSLNLLEFLQPHFVDIVVECQEWPLRAKVSCDYKH